MQEDDFKYEVKQRLTRIETLLDTKFVFMDGRITKLETNQRWVAITLIGAILAQIMDKLM